MSLPDNCPQCGQQALELVTTRQSVSAPDGTLLHYEDRPTRCAACGEAFYTPEQSLNASRARATALRAHAGLLTPAAIRAIRDQYGLSQADLEKALGFGPKTVVRWERGSVCQSNAADNLLVIARDFPGVFADIARRNGVLITQSLESPAPRTAFHRGIVLQFQYNATIDRGMPLRQRKTYGRFRVLHRSTCEQSTGNAADGCFETNPTPLKIGVA
jgi:HTH-type transcriptional regulator/antitoxin MqsA